MYDKYLLPMARDSVERAIACKHPWRVANQRFSGKLNTPQREVLATLISLRGKQSHDYIVGAPDTNLQQPKAIISTERKLAAMQLVFHILDNIASDDVASLDKAMSELYSREDLDSFVLDAALLAYSNHNKISTLDSRVLILL